MQQSSSSENLFVNYVHLIFLSLVFFFPRLKLIIYFLCNPFVISLHCERETLFLPRLFARFIYENEEIVYKKSTHTQLHACLFHSVIWDFFIWTFCLHFFRFRLNICIISDGRFVRFYSENETFEKSNSDLHICGISHLATSLKQIHEQFGKRKRNRQGHRDHAITIPQPERKMRHLEAGRGRGAKDIRGSVDVRLARGQ